MTLMTTQGTSAMEVKPICSCIKENPGPLVAVTLFAPAREAPITAPRLAISSSIWMKAKKVQPAARAPFTQASLPESSSAFIIINYYGEIGAPELTETTAIATLLIVEKGMAVRTNCKSLFGTESDTNSTSLAPVLEYFYISCLRHDLTAKPLLM